MQNICFWISMILGLSIVRAPFFPFLFLSLLLFSRQLLRFESKQATNNDIHRCVHYTSLSSLVYSSPHETQRPRRLRGEECVKKLGSPKGGRARRKLVDHKGSRRAFLFFKKRNKRTSSIHACMPSPPLTTISLFHSYSYPYPYSHSYSHSYSYYCYCYYSFHFL